MFLWTILIFLSFTLLLCVVFITGLICSTGMGMPVSGFPNQTA